MTERLAHLYISSWIGLSMGASHYYAELRFREKSLEVTRRLTARAAAKLNKSQGTTWYRAGMEFDGFDSREKAIQAGIAACRKHFPEVEILILGRHTLAEPQSVLFGPEAVMTRVNELAQQANWNRDNETEMKRICDEWDEIMRPYR